MNIEITPTFNNYDIDWSIESIFFDKEFNIELAVYKTRDGITLNLDKSVSWFDLSDLKIQEWNGLPVKSNISIRHSNRWYINCFHETETDTKIQWSCSDAEFIIETFQDGSLSCIYDVNLNKIPSCPENEDNHYILDSLGDNYQYWVGDKGKWVYENNKWNFSSYRPTSWYYGE